MNYLSHYTEQSTTNALNNAGAFFAFSNTQFDEKKVDNVVYVSMGAGLICPKDNAKKLHTDMDNAIEQGIAADLKENGIKKIIHRELSNYECQITGDYSEAVEAVKGYGITEKQVENEWQEFFLNCIDNDYF